MRRKQIGFRFVAIGCLVAMLGATALAQPGGGGFGGRGGGGGFGGRGGGGFGGFGGRGGDTIGFVLREDVQKELGLSESDVQALRSVVEEAQQESGELRRDMFANFRDMSADEREKAMAEMQEKMAAATKKAREAVQAKLSSQQKQRYAELEFQYQVQQGNPTAALQAADIELSKADEEKLAEATRKAREELRQKTAELTRQVYAKALADVVDTDVDKLMGTAFTFEDTRPQFGRGGGGPGGGGGGNQARGGRQRGGNQDGGGENARRPARPSGNADSDANPRRAR